MLPAILTLIVLACGGGFFVFKKVQEKKKEQEVAKPDPYLIREKWKTKIPLSENSAEFFYPF